MTDGRVARLRCELLELRELPSGGSIETFDTATAPALPNGWTTLSNDTTAAFATAAAVGLNGTTGLLATARTSRTAGFAFPTTPVVADSGVAVSAFLNSLVPVFLFARGAGLDTSTPSYVAVHFTRGLTLEIYEVIDGQMTLLGQLRSPPTSYLSNCWVQVKLLLQEADVAVQVVRLDDGRYLTPQGTWETQETVAVAATTRWQPRSGLVGVGRAARYSGDVVLDNFVVFPPKPEGIEENFDAIPAGTIPPGWQTAISWAPGQWSTTQAEAASLPRALTSSGGSTTVAAAWPDQVFPADVRAAVSVYADSLLPARLIIRGNNLDSATPSYYAVQLRRGLDVALIRVVNGQETVLGTLRSQQWLSNQWVRIQLTAQGDLLRAVVIRTDTQQWLSADGSWSDTPDIALEVRDGQLRDGGYVGLFRPSLYAGTVMFDDFSAAAYSSDQALTVTVAPTSGSSPFRGDVTFRAVATGQPVRLEFRLNGVLRAVAAASPAEWTLDTTTLPNGTHQLVVRAFDAAGNLGTAEYFFATSNDGQDPIHVPDIPRHFPHIRIAQLAYNGNPMGAFEQSLLRDAVDLVVPNARYLSLIDSVAPTTPQLIYSNVSNLYLNMLTDWLAYADRHGVSRELAFYHVTRATPFSGTSPSSRPVTWFWGAYQITPLGTIGDITRAVRDATAVSLGGTDTSTLLGYPERFREINLQLQSGASSGWSGVWEYVAATDDHGQPTLWKPLPLIHDGTSGQRNSGRVSFDPPSDWKPARIAGSERLYYVRFRVTSGTAAQQAVWLNALGRDYVHANGGTSGVIPAFDYSADRDGDGYLNDAEYARRRTGYDARFVYESRLFYPYYGQMRYVTHPADAAVRRWAVDYHLRWLDSQPLADGLFLDNSTGRAPFSGIGVLEPTTNYADDSAAMIAAISRAIAPRWVMINTAGGGSTAVPLTAAAAASFEEFLLRPLQTHWSQVVDIQNLVSQRLAPPQGPYLILDSHPGGGSPSDPRTQIATLAYYYQLADPRRTFLMFYGGYNPASSWTEHWSPAAAVDIGQPRGQMRTFAEGADPADPRLRYRIYARDYDRALVLYKPLSYAQGVGSGGLDDATATLHTLPGSYRRLNADGSLGPVITSIRLRNGEGAILIRIN